MECVCFYICNIYELLIATRLAAQCTDARVNMVTPRLFDTYKDVNAFAKMTEETPLGTLLEHLHELNVHFRGVEEHIKLAHR